MLKNICHLLLYLVEISNAYHELLFQYVGASLLFFSPPLFCVQGFCLSQVGEEALEDDCGDQGLLLLLGVEDCCSHRLEMVGRLG